MLTFQAFLLALVTCGLTLAWAPSSRLLLLRYKSSHRDGFFQQSECRTSFENVPRAPLGSPLVLSAVHVDQSQQQSTSERDYVDQDAMNDSAASAPEHLDNVNLSIEVPSINYEDLQRKIVNAILLAASFGWALYALLHVDLEMTRGWTASETAMRTSIDNWSLYESSLAERPIATKTMINTIIFLLGDWLSQTIFQKKNILDFDPKRVVRNGFIGLCFGPLVHEYYQFSDYILPVEGGIWNRVEKIIMDQTIYLTVKCSIYIAAVGLMQGDDFPTVRETVKGRIGGIVTTAWKFWPLVHVVTYSVIPDRHRMLWVNCVDLVWNAILAAMSQKQLPGEEQHQVVTDDPFILKQDVFQNSTIALFEQDVDSTLSFSLNSTAASSSE